MTAQATPAEIREWATYLRQSADDLEGTIPEVEKISGKVKVPKKTFPRLQEEVGRLLIAIDMGTMKARRKLPMERRKRPKRRGGDSTNGETK